MKTKFTLLIVVLLAFSSCVDIIDLPIVSSEPHPVIEAYIDYKTFATASVTMSAAYNDVIDYSQVEAAITLTSSTGEQEVLQFNDSLNLYQGSKILGVLNTSYHLSVVVDTSTFEVESNMSDGVDIDSINCEYNESLSDLMQKSGQEGEGDEPFYDSLYNVTVYYTDIVDEENYYLVRLAQNGVTKISYNLNNDRDADGEVMRSMFIEGLALSDTLAIFMYSLDKGAYTYYEGLNDLGGSDIPYNPYTNITGSTVVSGFFAARFSTSQTFLLRDKVDFGSEEEVY